MQCRTTHMEAISAIAKMTQLMPATPPMYV